MTHNILIFLLYMFISLYIFIFTPFHNRKRFTPVHNRERFTLVHSRERFTPAHNRERFTPVQKRERFTPVHKRERFTPVRERFIIIILIIDIFNIFVYFGRLFDLRNIKKYVSWYLFRLWYMKSEAFRYYKSFEHSPKPSKHPNYTTFNDSNVEKF